MGKNDRALPGTFIVTSEHKLGRTISDGDDMVLITTYWPIGVILQTFFNFTVHWSIHSDILRENWKAN